MLVIKGKEECAKIRIKQRGPGIEREKKEKKQRWQKRKKRRRKERTKTKEGPQCRTLRLKSNGGTSAVPPQWPRDLHSHAAADPPLPRLTHTERKIKSERESSSTPLVAPPPTRHLHDPIIWFPLPHTGTSSYRHPALLLPRYPAIPRPLSTYHKPLEGANLLLPDPPSPRPLKSTVRPTACVPHPPSLPSTPGAPSETTALVCTSLSTPCGHVHLPPPPHTSFVVQFLLISFSFSSSLGSSFLCISFSIYMGIIIFFYNHTHVMASKHVYNKHP